MSKPWKKVSIHYDFSLACLDEENSKSLMFGVTAVGNSVAVHIEIRHMTDWETEGKIWIRISKGDWRKREDQVTNCQIEVDVDKESYA